MPDNEPIGVPKVTDKRPKIAGLVPKNAQNLLLGSIALLMILAILFSGKNAPKEHAKPAPAAMAMEPSQSRIQEYRNRIDEQTRKLAAEEAQLAQTKQAFGLRETEPAPPPTYASVRTPPSSAYLNAERAEPETSKFEIERQKREYQSLFASNIALSYRSSVAPVEAPKVPSTAPRAGASAVRGDPVGARKSEGLRTPSGPLSGSEQTAATGGAPMHRLFEGTILETVLTNRLDGSFSGPVNCMVTANVYSHDGSRLLIPQGTRVLGEVKKLDSFGQQRLAVFFHRLIMPDGFSLSLDQFQGLDQIGETGLKDQINHHYLQIFGVSVAIGAFAGLAQANARYGFNQSGADAYEQGVASSFSQSALHILDRYLNVLPTFTIREGYRVKVYLSQDLMVPAYEEHPVRDDL